MTEKLSALVQREEKRIYAFLRDLIAIRSFDGEEGPVISRIREEMERIGFDEIKVDPMGNLIGRIGNGPHIIAFDGHVDTVTCGDLKNWEFDPFRGMEDDEVIGGLGSTDQKGGLVSAIYAAKLMKEIGLPRDITVLITASVQEEDSDGRSWLYMIEEQHVRPDFAVLTEPCDGIIRNGQRGRMEIKVTTPGRSAHGSVPEKGDNAIYKMASIISAIERMNENMTDDGVLGKGSVTISEIYSTAPSRCAVADSCSISLDRRLNAAETPQTALAEVRNLPEVIAANAEVSLYTNDDPSYTGLHFPIENYFPSWIISPDAVPCRSMKQAFIEALGREPEIRPWLFSTNGVAIMGRHRIPCVGFGPGHTDQAHRPNEKTWKKELLECCAVYTALPFQYESILKEQ